ncbi:energy transducer TonB [Sphingomonas sp. A2-49]|uniref:energy transducer TonB n=1 Tax=Sphingomonas sp. A2-49 TaxID=1391375 RepID=UPI0021D0805C|nr:energy transducer TonB [Sphingomonas sp. A2-49]MCU6452574.1 energy transducer TonB [Sphingomonas sp. A2-49]
MVIAPAPLRERLGAAALTALIVVALGYALVLGLAFGGTAQPVQQALATFDLAVPPPPPERVIPPPRKINRPSGRASPPNLRSKATEVTAPVPVIQLAPPPPVVVAPLPNIGVQATSGASDRAGPGTGAGGIGDGNGAGGDGDGDGSGFERVPRLIDGRIKGSDIPDPILDIGFRGVVGVRYRVETNGRVTGCTVARSSGNTLMDQATCRAIEKRFRYVPWRDAAGRPVRSTVLRDQQWDIDPPTIDQ